VLEGIGVCAFSGELAGEGAQAITLDGELVGAGTSAVGEVVLPLFGTSWSGTLEDPDKLVGAFSGEATLSVPSHGSVDLSCVGTFDLERVE
jgi:hypothetical protein